MPRFILPVFSLLLVFSSCKQPASRQPPPPPTFRTDKLMEMDSAIEQAIAGKKLPGGVLWLERNGVSYHKAYGRRSLIPNEEPMTEDTIFDAASLTKVLACTPAVMLLLQRQAIGLDDTVHYYVADFKGGGKETVTIRQLLTHTSGLRPDVSTAEPWSGYDKAIELACAEKLINPPGTTFVYSDINFFLLGHIVEAITGRKLNEFVDTEIYQPLKMSDTRFRPIIETNAVPSTAGAADKDVVTDETGLSRIAPTQESERGMLRGVVHDPTARRMGGVAGHAGLFSTASDLARFARMMLNEGELDGIRVFHPVIVRLMTSVQTPASLPVRRGLGWDIDSGYSRPRGKLFPLGSYGHTGFTGTSLWIDPFSRTFWIFLSNRVHPDGKGNILPLQAALATLAGEAVADFDFTHVAGALPPLPSRSEAATVLNGIDVLKKSGFVPLKGLRVGLVTNHTGRDRDGNTTIDLLKNAPGVDLKALFSPEHGIRGELDEKVGDGVDAKTGLPVYSLYGVRRTPAPEQLDGLDALVFDIQDVGCRFYTYISTMGNCLEAAAKAKLKFFVLDRVNPINGMSIEGPVHDGASSFTAYHALSLRYGMTMGELAQMFNTERGINAELKVIRLEGWKRRLWFDETRLPWVNPSPNMRSLVAATVYPGVGLLETAISVGRGTDTPFEIAGAPYIDPAKLAQALNNAGLSGIRFEPITFTPSGSIFKSQECGGVKFVLADRDPFRAVDLGIVLALTLERLYPGDFALEKMQPLLQSEKIIEMIRAGKSLEEIRGGWGAELENFRNRRTPFLIYE